MPANAHLQKSSQDKNKKEGGREWKKSLKADVDKDTRKLQWAWEQKSLVSKFYWLKTNLPVSPLRSWPAIEFKQRMSLCGANVCVYARAGFYSVLEPLKTLQQHLIYILLNVSIRNILESLHWFKQVAVLFSKIMRRRRWNNFLI